MKKLTYTRVSLRAMAKNLPYLNIPEYLRTPYQQMEYDNARKKFLKACDTYEKETGKLI